MISPLAQINPQLNEIWRAEWTPGTVEPARYLYDHELVLILKGSCVVDVLPEKHHLETGDFLIIPPGRNHVTTTGPEGVFRNCLHFHWAPSTRPRSQAICSFYPRKPKLTELTPAPAFVPKSFFKGRFLVNGTVRPLLETIFLNWQSGDSFQRALCRAHFLELLTHLLSTNTASTPAISQSSRLAYAVKELLERESREPLQILLPTLGFSYAHLCRLFHKKFGVTPGDYRNSIRLERAKALLRDPHLTVAQVAYQAGFDDPAYFTRLFRRRYDMPPSALR